MAYLSSSSSFTNWLTACLIWLAGTSQLRAQPAPAKVSTPVAQTSTADKRIASKAAIAPDQPISMIIMSDTQLHWWRAATDPDCNSPACVKQQGRRTNLNMLSAVRNINSLGAWPTGAARKSDVARINQSPAAISLNGDLTNYFHPDEFADYKEFWDSGLVTPPLYPGLGNHDYYNNTPTNGSNPPGTGTPDCGTPACAGSTHGFYSPDYWRNAKEAVWYMANKLTDGSLPNVVNRDLGGYISLHNTAGFNIRLTISYRPGPGTFTITRTSDGFEAGQWRAFPVPRGATQVNMTVEKNNGSNWVSVGTVNNLSVTRNCFKVEGTLANTTLANDECRREWPTGSEGSLSYSYEIGKYHFVQLQLNPKYEVDMIERPLIDATRAAYDPGKSPGFKITSSYNFNWLRNDLVDATTRGKIIIIQVHSDSGYGGVSDPRFASAVSNQNVVAVFSGHLHEQWGHRSTYTYNNGRNRIRFFRSGSAEAERMLYAEFHDSYFNVGVVKTNNGVPVFNTDPTDSIPDMGGNPLDPMDYTYRWSNTSHITADGQPVSQTVCLGQPANFWASVSTDANQFQWQLDANTGRFEDIAPTDTRFTGATLANLVINAATTAMSGYRFRIRVQSDSGELTTSDAAALTVRPTAPPARAYVNASAAGANNGTSWANAYRDLQSALQATCPALEIWVAKGVYKPGTANARSASFTITNGVALYGGFAGNETTLSQRNLSLNPTILSGDIDGNDTNADGDNIADRPTDIQGANSYHVVTVPQRAQIRLDGFIVTAGNSNDNTSSTNKRGGGVFVDFASGTLANCTVRGNFATEMGGGLFYTGQSLTLINCAFSGNTAGRGGAVAVTEATSVALISCALASNTATISGGGLHIDAAVLSIKNSIVWGNTAPQNANINGNFTATYSNIQGVTTGTGNLNLDPQFIDAPDGDLRPNRCSPLINAGDPSSTINNNGQTDLASNTRVLQARIDIGAYEVLSVVPVAIVNQPPGSLAACPGGTVTISVNATGTVGGYQWYRNNVAITGVASATTAALSLTNVQAASTGNYKVVVRVADCPISLTSTTLSLSLTTAQARVYVNDNATGTNTGSSWTNAYRDLQSALQSCPVPEVWVAAGLYKPTSTTDRTVSFVVPPGTAIYGGFAGTETLLSQRNLSINRTVLSGDIDNNDVDRYGIAFSDNYADIRGNNSRHVVILASNTSAQSRLDGLIITAGKADGTEADGTPNRDRSGAGVYTQATSSTIANCRFVGNQAFNGAGFYTDTPQGAPVLINSSFSGNSATNGGGLVSSRPTLINCTLFDNQALDSGGGAYVGIGTGTVLLNTIVWANTAPIGPGLFGTFTATYSDIQHGPTTGTGNIVADPQITNNIGRLTLGACSPALNTGDPATSTSVVGLTDVQSFPRFANGRIDMGAFESGTVPLVITQQPPSQSVVCPGSTVTASVSFTGSATSYQWYRSGTLLASATSSTLSLTNVQTASSGAYVLVITGACYSLTSTVFSLTVSRPARAYVNDDASGVNTGQDWPNAYRDLQSALTAGCQAGEIWIARGLYKPTNTADRTVSFTIPTSTSLYGGFLGVSSETILSQRNLSLNPTILSGDIDNNDANTDGNSIAESHTAIQGNNSYHVVTIADNASIRLDGLVVTAGQATGVGVVTNVRGGGLYADTGGGVLANCRFMGNTATDGGGVFAVSSSLTVINTGFAGNQAGFGAALLNRQGNTVLLNTSLATNRATTNGAGLYTNTGSFLLTNSIIWGNTAPVNTAITGSFTATYSNIEGVATGTGNTQADPLFVDATTGNLALRSNSPVINLGNPATTTTQVGATDLASNPRIVNTRIDMGAYEFQGGTGPIFTLKTGSWNDPTVWSVGYVPGAGERVELRHVVTLPAGYVASCQRMGYTVGGRLTYGAGARLRMGL